MLFKFNRFAKFEPWLMETTEKHTILINLNLNESTVYFREKEINCSGSKHTTKYTITSLIQS
jgi:hypothetical protein